MHFALWLDGIKLNGTGVLLVTLWRQFYCPDAYQTPIMSPASVMSSNVETSKSNGFRVNGGHHPAEIKMRITVSFVIHSCDVLQSHHKHWIPKYWTINTGLGSWEPLVARPYTTYVFLFKDTLLTRHSWFIYIGLMANNVRTHAWTMLTWHMYFLSKAHPNFLALESRGEFFSRTHGTI